jgi:hypothetical protein
LKLRAGCPLFPQILEPSLAPCTFVSAVFFYSSLKMSFDMWPLSAIQQGMQAQLISNHLFLAYTLLKPVWLSTPKAET